MLPPRRTVFVPVSKAAWAAEIPFPRVRPPSVTLGRVTVTVADAADPDATVSALRTKPPVPAPPTWPLLLNVTGLVIVWSAALAWLITGAVPSNRNPLPPRLNDAAPAAN